MYGAYFSYRLVLHKYTVIVSASSFSALLLPHADRSDTAVTIAKSTAKTLFHFILFHYKFSFICPVNISSNS